MFVAVGVEVAACVDVFVGPGPCVEVGVELAGTFVAVDVAVDVNVAT